MVPVSCSVDHHHLQALWGMHRPEGLPGRHRQPPCCFWRWHREQRRPHPHFCWCRRGSREGPGSVDLWAHPRAPCGAACWLHWCDCNCSTVGPLPDPGSADPRGAGSGLRCHPGFAALSERLPQRRAHRPGRASSPAPLPSCTWATASAAASAQLRLTDTSVPLRYPTGFRCGGGKGTLQGEAGGAGHLFPLVRVRSLDHRGR